MTRKIKAILVRLCCLLLFVLLVSLALLAYSIAYKPLLKEHVAPTTLKVYPGTGIDQLTAELVSRHFISQPYFFSQWAKWTGRARKIKTGEYRITSAMSASDLLDAIVKGHVARWRITFIEGWTFRKMKAALEKNQHVTSTLKGLTDKQIMGKVGYPGRHPEGLFFPDTYYFKWGDTDVDILKRAYQAMDKLLKKEWPLRAPGLPYKTSYEALIVASLIEKETALNTERKKVAGVIIRRLKKRMRLQVDPTVLYGLGKPYGTRITRSDLKSETPYNTYRHYGLPPTPIDMPGRASLIAALHPEPGKALYYMSRGNGSHQFSETYSLHTHAVKQYRSLMHSRQEFKTSPDLHRVFHLLWPWVGLVASPRVCFYGLRCYHEALLF